MQVTPLNAILPTLSVTQFAQPLIVQQPLLLLPHPASLPSPLPHPFSLSPSKLLVAPVTAPHYPFSLLHVQDSRPTLPSPHYIVLL